MALRDGTGSFKVGLERSKRFGVGGKSSRAEISDLGDGDNLFFMADHACVPWYTFGRFRRSKSNLGIQRYDILSLLSPEAVARRAAVPLSVGRPFTISHRHTLLVLRREAVAPAASPGTQYSNETKADKATLNESLA